MLLALGLFVFQNDTLAFDELQRRTAWKHAKAGRVGARDASQFLGPGDDSVTLSGALLPEVSGTFASMRKLREMADEGESWSLVTGSGEVLGDFVILSIDERRKYMLIDGTPRWTDFTIELERVA